MKAFKETALFTIPTIPNLPVYEPRVLPVLNSKVYVTFQPKKVPLTLN